MMHTGEVILRAVLSLLCAAYIAVTLAFVAFGITQARKPEHSPLSPDPAISAALREVFKPSLSGRVVGSLQVLSWTLQWPLTARDQRMAKRQNNMEVVALLSLRPHDAQSALVTLVVTVFVSGLAALDLLWTPIRVLALVILVASISLRELSYLVSSLPQRLCRSLFEPITSFFLIAVADFLSLVFCASSLRNHPGTNLEWSALRDTMIQLFNLPRQVVNIGHLAAMDGLWLLIGLIYYTAVFKSIAQVRQASRKATDYQYLATYSLYLGDADGATRYLSAIPAAERDWLWAGIGANVALVRGDFARAVELGNRARELNGETPDNGETIFRLLDATLLLPMSKLRRITFVEHLAVLGVSDIIAYSALNNQIIMLEDPDELATACRDRFPGATYPLAASLIAFVDEDLALAYQLVEQMRPERDIDRLVGVVHLAMFIYFDPDLDLDETKQKLDGWFDRNLLLIRHLATHLESSRERALALGVLGQLANLMSEMFASEPDLLARVASLRELASEIADSPEQFEQFRRASAALFRGIDDRAAPGATGQPV
jgi:hypothetical protein